MKKVLLVSLVLCISVLAQNKDKQKADVIFVHGDFYIGATNQASAVKEDHATSLAVANGRVIGYGASDADISKSFKGPNTKIIDLGGHFAMPGFNDAHAHIASGGQEKLNVNLVGCRSLAEMQSRIADRAKTTAPGEWILGEGWDHTMWPTKTTPTRQDLDKVTGDHPAIFGRVDGHIAVANTAALKLAGITKDTKAPAGSAIDKDASGEPTGILRESPAVRMVYAKVPAPNMERRIRGLQLALAEAASSGVTSIQDYSDWQDFLALEQLEKEGKLTARISEWLTFGDSLDTLKQQRAHHSTTDPMLHTGFLKGFMDGSLGSRTAALLAPYADDPKNSGIPRYEQEKLNAMAAERANDGFQIGFHAIGDRGARMALDAFAYAIQKSNKKNLRFRIEHDQVVSPDD